MDDESARCSVCGQDCGGPEYLCYCDLCGGVMCDDCFREDDEANMHYCVNCWESEVDSDMRHEVA